MSHVLPPFIIAEGPGDDQPTTNLCECVWCGRDEMWGGCVMVDVQKMYVKDYQPLQVPMIRTNTYC